MENNPEAAPAPASTEETPQNTTPEQTPAQDQPTNTINLTEEQQKFIQSNGGWEKAFENFKKKLTERPAEPAQPTKPAEPAQPAQPEQKPAQPAQPQTPPTGYLSQQDLMLKHYYGTLAGDAKYSAIKDKITSGEIFNEMKKFNIQPVQNGYINDQQVRDFLDLYAKTVPAQPTSTPITNTPTVEFVNVGKEITSQADALKVMAQPNHPMREQAMKFMGEAIMGTQKKK